MQAPETEITIRGGDGAVLLQTVVAPGEYVLGRSPQAELHFEADLVSRQHARLTVNADHLLIEDLGSANGTFVDGRRVTEATRFRPDEKVQIGLATLEFRRLNIQPPPDVPPAPSAQALQRLLPEEFLRAKKYDIGGVVARGGMGAILDAREATTERKVAMKVMFDGSSPEDLARFVAEAKVTAQLEHPNIVPVHELSVDENGRPFYTMKMVRGITLGKVLELMAARTETTLAKYPLTALLNVFQKVCDAIAFAHSRGIIHRDIKPENIMLGDYGEVLVMDWGLAKFMDGRDAGAAPSSSAGKVGGAGAPPSSAPGDGAPGHTPGGTIMGTPAYMSPEQARGEVDDLDARSDIFALGAILYELLALRPPVAGGTAREIVDKVARGEFEPLASPSPSSSRPGDEPGLKMKRESHLPGGRIPDSLAAVVGKAMAFDRDQRYWTVEELQSDLTAYQNGFATSAENAGLGKQLLLAVKRHKAVATSIATALVVLAAVASVAFVRITGEKNRATRALADLRRTAPTFHAQALALIKDGKLDKALDKIDTAVSLDPSGDYLALKGCILQSLFRFKEAAAVFEATLAGDPGLALARENAALSLQLAPQLTPDGTLPKPGQETLLAALEKQGRKDEALLLANALGRTANFLRNEIVQRLQRMLKLPDTERPALAKRIGTDDTGGLSVDLSDLPINDLSPLQGLPIMTLKLHRNPVSDLRPLRGMPLRSLMIAEMRSLKTLEPLRGLPLIELEAPYNYAWLKDLSPLVGMKLEFLNVSQSPVTDITPIRGMPLRRLGLYSTKVSDLGSLKGMPLEEIRVGGTPVSDLSPLADMPLKYLGLTGCRAVNDLNPIRNLPLDELYIGETGVADLSPLRGKPLKILELIGCSRLNDIGVIASMTKLLRLDLPLHITDLDSLRKHPTLQQFRWLSKPSFESVDLPIPAPRFWRHYDEFKAAEMKFAAAFAEQGATFTPGKHLTSTRGEFFEVDLTGTPLRDLRFLEGLPVAVLKIASTGIADLAPVARCPLAELHAAGSQIDSLAPLAGSRLSYLDVINTKVTDLSPLREMPLTVVFLRGSAVTDVSPLATCRNLKALVLPAAPGGVKTLRTLPQLSTIGDEPNASGDAANKLAVDFWKECDAQPAAGKK